LKLITSVTGTLPWNTLDVVDAHNHVWIDPVSGSNPNNPVLNNFNNIARELIDYKKSGGNAIVDCQPGGCGRNGTMLAQLSKISGVAIISATGFHRPIYYSSDYWLWQSNADKITDVFIQEIEKGEQETLESDSPVKSGFIKIACEVTLEKTYQPALHAAAEAARQTCRSIEIHTEKGESAREILSFFVNLGVDPHQIILCHMDKRPDIGLHCELAQAGAALEYDTFFRTKYQPEVFLWPLILKMIAAGFENQICLATDMAEEVYWTNPANGPGLSSLPVQIRKRLLDEGLNAATVHKLTGENICRILATEIDSD
jgi:5-phospho-D-xylono-1,4-lactonase